MGSDGHPHQMVLAIPRLEHGQRATLHVQRRDMVRDQRYTDPALRHVLVRDQRCANPVVLAQMVLAQGRADATPDHRVVRRQRRACHD